MSEQRKHYNQEFKQRAVKYVQEQSKSITQIALEMDIPVDTLYRWVAKYRQFENEPVASLDKVRQLEQLLLQKERELQEKERHVSDLEEKLEIVKKVVHIFSNPRSKRSRGSINSPTGLLDIYCLSRRRPTAADS